MYWMHVTDTSGGAEKKRDLRAKDRDRIGRLHGW